MSNYVKVGNREIAWGYDYDQGWANNEREDAVVVALLDDGGEIVGLIGGVTLSSLSISDHGNVNINQEDEEYLRSLAQGMAEDRFGHRPMMNNVRCSAWHCEAEPTQCETTRAKQQGKWHGPFFYYYCDEHADDARTTVSEHGLLSNPALYERTWRTLTQNGA